MDAELRWLNPVSDAVEAHCHGHDDDGRHAEVQQAVMAWVHEQIGVDQEDFEQIVLKPGEP